MLAASEPDDPERVAGGDERAGEAPDVDGLAIEAGDQALLAVPSMRNPLELLPDHAFDNLLVATVRSPAKIERHVDRRGLDPQRVGVVPLSNADNEYEGPLWTSRRLSPTDLTGISIECSRGGQYLRRGEGWFVLDNIHTLLMYSDDRRVYQLLDSLRASMGQREIRGCYAVVRATVGTEYQRYRTLFDVEIDRT